MRVVFMGTPIFSVPILQMLIESDYEVVGVVTQPDKPVGRKRIITPTPIKKLAVEKNIDVFQPEHIKDDYQKIIDWNPDIIVTAAYGQIIPKELLDYPKYHCINVHASLLPKYRGGAPIHKSIIDGNEQTGITIMYMEEKMDSGDIISQKIVDIDIKDNVGTLHDKLSLTGAKLLIDTLPNIFSGNTNPRKQDQSEVTYSWNIKREDERVVWTRDGEDIYNQIRGLNPWPGAYTTIDNIIVKIWEANTITIIHNQNPGKIIRVIDDGIVVSTGNTTSILIKELQISGKKRMKASDYIKGNNVLLSIDKYFDK